MPRNYYKFVLINESNSVKIRLFNSDGTCIARCSLRVLIKKYNDTIPPMYYSSRLDVESFLFHAKKKQDYPVIKFVKFNHDSLKDDLYLALFYLFKLAKVKVNFGEDLVKFIIK